MAERTETTKARGRTLSREDFIRAAIDAVVRGGADALRIDRLCHEFDVTKGSFYHHFASRDALVEAMADYWARAQPEQVIAVLGELGEAPLDKLKLLIRLFTDLEIGTRDHAMRAFGANDARIGAAVDAADALVLATLEAILASLGLSPADTRAFARIMMFSAIGFYSAPNLLGEDGPRELGKRILELMMERSHAQHVRDEGTIRIGDRARTGRKYLDPLIDGVPADDAADAEHGDITS